MKKKTFIQLMKEEGFTIPTSLVGAKRVQRYSTCISVDFELDKSSIELLEAAFPLKKCRYTLLKKIAENIIILNREKYEGTNETRLNLMQLPVYRGYRDSSFNYSIE